MCKHLLGQLKIHLCGEGVRYHRNMRFRQMPEGREGSEGRAVHWPIGKALKLMQIEGTPGTREVGDGPGERQNSNFPSHFLFQLTPPNLGSPNLFSWSKCFPTPIHHFYTWAHLRLLELMGTQRQLIPDLCSAILVYSEISV